MKNQSLHYICVETSLKKGFVSICTGNNVQKEYTWSDDKHSNQITNSLSELELYSKMKHTDLQFLAVDVGPGRFTGIRIGVTFSKVLAYYLNIPIFPIHSLRLMADSYLKRGADILCLMEAYGNMFFVAGYTYIDGAVEIKIPPVSLSLEDLEKKISTPYICIGDVYNTKKHLFSKSLQGLLKTVDFDFISSENFANTVVSEWEESKLKTWKEVDASYLRIPGSIKR